MESRPFALLVEGVMCCPQHGYIVHGSVESGSIGWGDTVQFAIEGQAYSLRVPEIIPIFTGSVASIAYAGEYVGLRLEGEGVERLYAGVTLTQAEARQLV